MFSSGKRQKTNSHQENNTNVLNWILPINHITHHHRIHHIFIISPPSKKCIWRKFLGLLDICTYVLLGRSRKFCKFLFRISSAAQIACAGTSCELCGPDKAWQDSRLSCAITGYLLLTISHPQTCQYIYQGGTKCWSVGATLHENLRFGQKSCFVASFSTETFGWNFWQRVFSIRIERKQYCIKLGWEKHKFIVYYIHYIPELGLNLSCTDNCIQMKKQGATMCFPCFKQHFPCKNHKL